jgi:hypothetical protein
MPCVLFLFKKIYDTINIVVPSNDLFFDALRYSFECTDDEKHARVFYKYVMGGGGFDIHYGIFRKPSDTVYEASKATNDRLLTCLDWTHPVTKDSVVLDLGSGHGGISHEVCIVSLCGV